MGSRAGARTTAAGRLGLTLTQYDEKIGNGEKWCTACKAWHPVGYFPRDRTRSDGRKAKCLAAERGKPRFPRNPRHERARSAVSYAVRMGRLPRASAVLCTDCGHLGSDRRHEYDHYLGYEPEHHLHVEPVCTTCHADRERARRADQD